MQHRRNCL